MHKIGEMHLDLSDYFEVENELMYCLEPLLKSLGWFGSDKSIIESLPHFSHSLSITKFLDIMQDFGYQTKAKLNSKYVIESCSFPFLLIDGETSSVVLEKIEDDFIIFSGSQKKIVKCKDLKGQAIFFSEAKVEDNISNKNILLHILSYKKNIIEVVIISFLLNLYILLMPFFVMTVYDKAIISDSGGFLINLVLGMFLVVTASIIIQKYQNIILAFISSKLNLKIGNKIFSKVLSLPLNKIETASLGAQVSKLREFEVIKDFISGPLVQAIVNIPFSIMLLIAMYLLAGSIVWVTISVVGILLISAIYIKPKVNKLVQNSTKLVAERQSFLVEAVHNIEQIKLCSAKNKWIERYREISGKVALANYKSNLLGMIVNYLSEALVATAVIVTISSCVYQVMADQLTVGGLIAVMMLVWRTLTPLKYLEANIPKIMQVKQSFKSIENLMAIQSEDQINVNRVFSTHIKGKLQFNKVVMSYQAAMEPVLMGASCTINAGELVMLYGPNGSGKSTVFHLLTKLYSPVSGVILIDGKDIRQINTYELRQLISYVPQKSHFFYGTILQNLRLANPLADMKLIKEILQSVDLYSEIESLEDGINTRFQDDMDKKFSASFLQRLSIARGLIKRPKLLLLDDPMQYLDSDTEEIILNTIKRLQNKITIIMITHRPSHLKLADKVMMINNGLIETSGKSGGKLANKESYDMAT